MNVAADSKFAAALYFGELQLSFKSTAVSEGRVRAAYFPAWHCMET